MDRKEEFERVQELFHELILKGAAERGMALDGEAASVRSQVEGLLAAAGREECDSGQAKPERTFGQYRAVERIGRGGMGEVWLAERTDGEIRMRVAVKTLRSNFAPEEFHRRFRFERQALAGLKHPNIASLLDGGVTASGTPYLVMELIEGSPILTHVRQLRLSPRQTVELWEQAARAVAHAHSRMILHRDLKPGNLLVTAEGVTKLLDFGTAKLLDREGDTDRTATGHQSFTPRYASPEQVLGQPSTMATDVWGLGVLLYEMLTGKPPFTVQLGTMEELLREICSKDAAGANLGGDLDSILAKSLRRDAAERYQRVEEMLEDIRAWQENRPVMARRGGLRYRIRKFVRRNRLALAAAAAVLAVAAMGGASTWHQYQLANERYVAMRDLSKSLTNELMVLLSRSPGTLDAQRLLISRTLTALEPLAAKAGPDSQLRLELARVYQRLGSLQGDPYQKNTGEPQKALLALDRAAALLTPGGGDLRGVAELRAAIDETRIGVLDSLGQREAAEEAARRALALLGPLSPKARTKMRESNLHLLLARYARERKQIAEARTHYRQSAEQLEIATQFDPQRYGGVPRVSMRVESADFLLEQKQAAAALVEIDAAETLFAALPEATRKSAGRVESRLLRKKAGALAAAGRYREAVAAASAAMALIEKFAALDPGSAQGTFDLAVVCNELAGIQEAAGSTVECRRQTRRARDYLLPLARSAGPKSAYAAALAETEARAVRMKFHF